MQLADIVKKAKQIEIQSKKQISSMRMGNSSSAFLGRGMQFSQVRVYQAGDEIRHIDWNKTAKYQQAFSKQMEEEREHVVFFAIDISASMNYGTLQEKKTEYLAQICASVAFAAQKQGSSLGLVLFGDGIKKILPPAKTSSQISALIVAILSAKYESCQVDYESCFSYLARFLPKGSSVFLFSDFQQQIPENTIKVLRCKLEVLAFCIYDEKEKQIPDMGYCQFVDSETGQRVWVNTSSRKWRYQYTEDFFSRQSRNKTFFSGGNCAYFSFETSSDYAPILHAYFQKR